MEKLTEEVKILALSDSRLSALPPQPVQHKASRAAGICPYEEREKIPIQVILQ
jgi:hypothetical protein